MKKVHVRLFRQHWNDSFSTRRVFWLDPTIKGKMNPSSVTVEKKGFGFENGYDSVMLGIRRTFGRHHTPRVRDLLVMLLEFQRQFIRFHVIDLLKNYKF